MRQRYKMLGTPELIAVSVVVLLLFGNRLPSVMRSLGVGITEFKKGIKGEGEPTTVIEDRRHEEPQATHSTHSPS